MGDFGSQNFIPLYEARTAFSKKVLTIVNQGPVYTQQYNEKCPTDFAI